MGYIWKLIMSSLLSVNALAILHEKRFLRRYGYDQLEASSGGSPSMKNQVVGFLVAVQYLRMPLVVINIVAIFLELLMG
ncbi:hypothetical protein SPRG_11844 [Saprolegnia parasitica CBS 223.65]|uniref:Yos1-like protein n=1 Tax=Saprolegnia parasitica (strain CBS 223.65) TaxID=695850 RepID=A0A067C849_SAPPC|nr:hypothetical protein SPRG_11844 [Saprolegnia parasitica CBS 223.65]KDO22997.1 hypothetical protein SPRG_11844 [Saprolegnia parasitica CBS 223.65]|eukprot:XP_012206288.1 hypothetical protein SPRG_11844 [Saprolegnia parasitica CBS 223.65]